MVLHAQHRLTLYIHYIMVHVTSLHRIVIALHHICITWHCIAPHSHYVVILRVVITLSPAFRIPWHCMPWNQTLGSAYRSRWYLQHPQLSTVYRLKMTPAVVHGQVHFLGITCSTSHAQPHHHTHTYINITYTTPQSLSLRAKLSE